MAPRTGRRSAAMGGSSPTAVRPRIRRRRYQRRAGYLPVRPVDQYDDAPERYRFGTAAGDNRSLAPVFSGDGQTWSSKAGLPTWWPRISTRAVTCLPTGSILRGQMPCSRRRFFSGGGAGRGPWPDVAGGAGQELPGAVQECLAGGRVGRPLNGSVTIVGKQGVSQRSLGWRRAEVLSGCGLLKKRSSI